MNTAGLAKATAAAVLGGVAVLAGCGHRTEASAGALQARPLQVHLSSPHPSPTAPAGEVVLVYGDSLTVQSESAVHFLYPHQQVVFRAINGAKMCDLAPGAAADRRAVRPTRVVIAFTGNTWGCAVPKGVLVGTRAQVIANYEQNLRLFARSYAGVPVTVVAPPAMKNPGTEGYFPYNGSPALIAMYRRVSAELGLHYSDVADKTLTPGHKYTADRPRYGTASPLVRVRASDGIHLLPAGEVYYAIALMTR